MKVFIYKKGNSEKVKVISNVKVVFECDNILTIDTEKETFTFDTRKVKATCYQN